MVSREDGRKTVQLKDIGGWTFYKGSNFKLISERAIRRNPLFEFLEDALSDWPEGGPNEEGISSDTQNPEETTNENDDNHEDQVNLLQGDILEDEGNLLQEDPMEVEEVTVFEESKKPIENPQSTPVKIRDIEDL